MLRSLFELLWEAFKKSRWDRTIVDDILLYTTGALFLLALLGLNIAWRHVWGWVKAWTASWDHPGSIK